MMFLFIEQFLSVRWYFKGYEYIKAFNELSTIIFPCLVASIVECTTIKNWSFQQALNYMGTCAYTKMLTLTLCKIAYYIISVPECVCVYETKI